MDDKRKLAQEIVKWCVQDVLALINKGAVVVTRPDGTPTLLVPQKALKSNEKEPHA